MSENTVDVLVVGAGPVGLFCANELQRHGLRCRIIDKKDSLSEHSKALGIHIRTLDVLEHSGLIHEVLTQGHPVHGVVFKSNGKTLMTATFDGIEATRHFLIDLPQNKTEAILNEHLKAKGIHVEWACELTHISQTYSGICATVSKPDYKIELLNADWVIACDGAHSTVRHLLDIPFEGAAYSQKWWLADVYINWSLPDDFMFIYVNEHGPMACFPMGNKRYRLVLSAPADIEGTPNLQQVQDEFNLRSTDPGALSNTVWLNAFSISHRQIINYRYDRIFFAGDAAHIHSPMGGQGLNTGMQDVYNLVWKLALAHRKQANSDILETYNSERYPVGRAVLEKTDKMTRMMLIKNPLLIALRNWFIHFVSYFKGIKVKMAKELAELNISYAKSEISLQSRGRTPLISGQYIPLFYLSRPDGSTISSIELLEGKKYHLLVFLGINLRKQDVLKKLIKELNDNYHFIMDVHFINTSAGQVAEYLDKDYLAHKQLGMLRSGIIVVRPDNYTCIVQTPMRFKSVQQYFKQWFLLPEIIDETTQVLDKSVTLS